MNYVSLKPILPAETPAGSVPRILKLLCCFLLRLKDNILPKNVPESRYDSWHDQKQLIDVVSYFDYQNIYKIKFCFKLSKISENFRRMKIFGNLEIAFQV